VFDGEANTVALESAGGGFGGDIGIMVGVNIKEDKIIGVSVTTHSETPGVGSKAKTDPSFTKQFNDLPLTGIFAVKTSGGQIDAISGATITSQGVSLGVTEAAKVYEALKPQIAEQLKSFTQ
jgi:electron transport complex protein RnfG